MDVCHCTVDYPSTVCMLLALKIFVGFQENGIWPQRSQGLAFSDGLFKCVTVVEFIQREKDHAESLKSKSWTQSS